MKKKEIIRKHMKLKTMSVGETDWMDTPRSATHLMIDFHDLSDDELKVMFKKTYKTIKKILNQSIYDDNELEDKIRWEFLNRIPVGINQFHYYYRLDSRINKLIKAYEQK